MQPIQQTPQVTQVADPVAKIGRIVAVTGAHAIILLERGGRLPGSEDESPEIGTLLKVDTEPSIALALISSLSTPTPDNSSGGDELRIAEVEFIGELPKDANGNPTHFRRGISCYPALGDIVGRASRQELAMAYACDGASSVRVGHIQQDPSIPAMIKTDELLGKHCAVLGTTGTGKSCTVALILRRILEANPQAHILLLDVHREYAAAFKEYGEIITPANLILPFWLLNFEEMVEILIAGQQHREADIEILRELIPMAKQRYKGARSGDKQSRLRSRESADDGSVGVDTPVPYRISDIVSLLDEALGKLELKGELAPYKRLKARIEQVSRDARYSFMFGSLTVHDSMAEILGHLFRIPVNNKPITILELGGLPSEIINVVVSVLARMAFDFGLWSGGRVPITFVCEEAHRYVPFDDTLGFEPTKRSISKIAKEGRKYGVSLCIVSQRPAELDPTILSQCSTVFSMRLTNERDQDILRAGISDAAASLLEFMPTMGAGEAIAFGEGVALPTRIKFDLLPAESLPKSTTASFTENWSHDVTDPNFLNNIVACWRQQVQITDSGATLDVPPAQAVQNAPQQAASHQPAPQPAPQPVGQPAPQPVPATPLAEPAMQPAFEAAAQAQVPPVAAQPVEMQHIPAVTPEPADVRPAMAVQQPAAPVQPDPATVIPSVAPAPAEAPAEAPVAAQPAPAPQPAAGNLANGEPSLAELIAQVRGT
jgi:DNA helicase HerA-like ATPase